MQLYRGMDIGTAKPSAGDRARVTHYMLDVLDPSERCSAARYREMAVPVIDTLCAGGIQPVLCGGTGLYIDALTKPRGFSVEGNPALRAELEALDKRQLHGMLRQIDPESAARLHVNDVRRVIRAIEVHRLTGITLTQQLQSDKEKPGDYPAKLFALDWPRDVLYERIDRRVDQMIGGGLVDEVRALLDTGVPRDATAMQAIGYKEIAQALGGEVSMDEAVASLKQATRNYAKRQLTWFRRDERVRWIEAAGKSAMDIAMQIMQIWKEAAAC